MASEIDLPRGGGWREVVKVLPGNTLVEIEDRWLISSTVIISIGQDTLETGVDYTWSDSLYAFKFSFSDYLSAGDTLHIRYQSTAITDREEFFYYQPDTTQVDDDSIDSPEGKPPGKRKVDPLGSWSGLHRSGMITRGVKFGDGSGDLSSGLHIELSGRPASGVTIDAILDDRDIPATESGRSKTLGELDRMLFRVSTSRFAAELGDWDLNWQDSRYGKVTRQLKGGRVDVKLTPLNVEVAAGGGDNTYRHMTIQGRAGDQGPYELTDRFGRHGITIVTGSERVYLDGIRLKHGYHADYTMDYQLGTLTFNPGIYIQDDSRIEVEFEYNDSAYPRYMYATRWKIQDQNFSLDASGVADGRSGERPLAFDWTDQWRAVASDAGDDQLGAVVSGVDSVGLGKGDYIWSEVNSMRILMFLPPDSLGKPLGYLNVVFSPDSAGYYRKFYDSSLQTFYFVWVAQSERGGWSPIRRLPLPDRTKQADLNMQYRKGDFQFGTEVAVTDYDVNTLSPQGDGDNIGTAWLWRGDWNRKGAGDLTVSAMIRREEQTFKPVSLSNEVDHNYRWNIADSLSLSETALETEIGFRPFNELSLTGMVGYLKSGHDYTGNRIEFGSDWTGRIVNAAARIDRIENENRADGYSTERINATGQVTSVRGRIRPSYQLRLENSRSSGPDDLESGFRNYENDISIDFDLTSMNSIELQYLYRIDDELREGSFNKQADTRIAKAGYSGRMDNIGGWSVEVQRFIKSFASPLMPDVLSTSAALDARIIPTGSRWQFQLDYNLSSGNSRTGVWVSSYTSAGQGDYRREGDRYVPDPDGNISLRQVLTDTLGKVSRVDLVTRLSWNVRHGRKTAKSPQHAVLGLTGVNSRIEARLTTSAINSLRAYLLVPSAIRADDALFSKLSWVQDFDFLQGSRSGDGRLSLRWDENRDGSLAGGEGYQSLTTTFRIRRRFGEGFSARLEPKWQNSRRKGLVIDEVRSDVTETGGDCEMTLKQTGSPLEFGIGFGYYQRRNDVSNISLIERRWQPRIVWTVGVNGAARFNAEWRRINAGSPYPGYDLDQGYSVGNSYKVSISFDYRLRSNLTVTTYYRGRWRGNRAPSHDGLVNFTATL